MGWIGWIPIWSLASHQFQKAIGSEIDRHGNRFWSGPFPGRAVRRFDKAGAGQVPQCESGRVGGQWAELSRWVPVDGNQNPVALACPTKNCCHVVAQFSNPDAADRKSLVCRLWLGWIIRHPMTVALVYTWPFGASGFSV